MAKAKIGAGHAHAMLRLGLKELRNAVTPSKESVADTEIGLYGTQTQGEIAEGRGGPGSGPNQEQKKTTLDALREESQKESAKEREKERELER